LRKTEGTGRKTQMGRKKEMKKWKEIIKINEWRKEENKRDISKCYFFTHVKLTFP
jgi:hypothetical protein